MTPEEQLDRLIERWERGVPLGQVANEELQARLAAARTLAQLQAIEVPPAFAARLEARLRARARRLALQNGWELAVPRPQPRVRSRRVLRGRAWITALGIAAVVLLMCIGAIAAAAQSLPGDPLYGLKRLEQQVALLLVSSPQDRAHTEISQLQSALADLRTVVNEQRPDEVIQEALGVVAERTSESQTAVAALSAGPDRVAAQRDLDSALAREDQTVRSLLAKVDWPLRLAFTQQLGVLGEAIPTIAKVTVSQPNQGHLLITVTGTNFAPGATLMINGVPKGTVNKGTATQLVVQISTSDWPSGPRTVGVQNPDGMAAQLGLKGTDDDNDQDDHPNQQGTPGVNGTPGNDSGDDGGGYGGSGGSSGTPTPTPTPGYGGSGGSNGTPTPTPGYGGSGGSNGATPTPDH